MNFEKRVKEIEESLDQEDEINEYLAIDQLTNDLERILENDVSTKQQISKEACLKESILKMFDSTKSERLEFDALDLTIKACYSQCHERN